MNTSLYIASTGLKSYQGKLDTIANNIANVDTAGYKRREAAFSENLAASIQNQAEAQKEVGRLSPNGIRTTFGSRIGATLMDNAQGTPQETDSPYDLMLEGNGFFKVLRNSGEVLYTRSGSFQLSAAGNGSFRLINADGDALLDQTGKPIVVTNTTNFQVLEDGTIAGTNQKIGVVTVSNPQLLVNNGGAFQLTGGTVSQAANFKLKQGALERSNVDISQEMTDMVKTQRGLQANARAISYADQMLGIANGIIRD
jgi:flagellar basal-body rod protein FlgG